MVPMTSCWSNVISYLAQAALILLTTYALLLYLRWIIFLHLSRSIIVLYTWLHLWFFVLPLNPVQASACSWFQLPFECQWLQNAWLPNTTFHYIKLLCSKQLVGYTVAFLCAYLAKCVWKSACRNKRDHWNAILLHIPSNFTFSTILFSDHSKSHSSYPQISYSISFLAIELLLFVLNLLTFFMQSYCKFMGSKNHILYHYIPLSALHWAVGRYSLNTHWKLFNHIGGIFPIFWIQFKHHLIHILS